MNINYWGPVLVDTYFVVLGNVWVKVASTDGYDDFKSMAGMLKT